MDLVAKIKKSKPPESIKLKDMMDQMKEYLLSEVNDSFPIGGETKPSSNPERFQPGENAGQPERKDTATE